MKTQLLYIVFLIIITGGYSCKKELDYPIIQTGKVTDIDTSGAVFHGKITNIGKQEIVEYGFVWGISSTPTITSSNIALGTTNELGVFSIKITNDLLKDTKYYVRAFAKNNEYIVYGYSLSFQSLGGIAPSISEFTPISGKGGDKITIYGDNFSANTDNNIIYLGDMELQVDSASKTKLIVTIPNEIAISGNVKIKCIVANQETISNNYYRIEGVTVLDFYPKELYGSDTIYIKCENHSQNLTENIIKINNSELELISLNDSVITGLVYYNESPGKKQISISTNGQTNTFIDSLKILETWSTIISDYPFIRNRRGHVAFLINNKGYVGAGSGYKDLWNYNSTNNKWARCSNFPFSGSYSQNNIGFSVNGKGYIGKYIYKDGSYCFEMFEYSPNQNTWIQKNDFIIDDKMYVFDFCIGNNAYIVLGEGDEAAVPKYVWKYDPADDTWTQLSNFPDVTFFIFDDYKFIIDNQIFLALETYNNGYNLQLWEYLFENDTWIKLVAPPITYNANLSIILSLNKYSIWGFDNNDSGVREYWRYNIYNSNWTRIADNIYEPERPISFKIDGTNYITSSRQNNSYHNEEIYLFNPNW